MDIDDVDSEGSNFSHKRIQLAAATSRLVIAKLTINTFLFKIKPGSFSTPLLASFQRRAQRVFAIVKKGHCFGWTAKPQELRKFDEFFKGATMASRY